MSSCLVSKEYIANPKLTFNTHLNTLLYLDKPRIARNSPLKGQEYQI